MHKKIVWIGIFVVLAFTVVAVVNCRGVPHPWEPTITGSAPSDARADAWLS